MAVVEDLAVIPYSVICDRKYENQEIVPFRKKRER